MLINDLVGLLENVPPMLSGAWAVWLFTGLVLSIWGRREGKRLVVHAPTTKHKSGVRPPSGDRTSRPVKRAPSAGDAFGELEALLEPPTGMHREPGQMPEPALLSAPQSLP